MTFDNDTERAFLIELYQATQGDPTAKTTMQKVGAAIGLDKEQAGKTAEELIGKGLVEIKTLSGGIGITAEGIAAAQESGAAPAGGGDLGLSPGPILNSDDRQVVEKILSDAGKAVAEAKADYARIEEMVMDIKTAEVHLLSPQPKTAVIIALLNALRSTLEKTGASEMAARLKKIVG